MDSKLITLLTFVLVVIFCHGTHGWCDEDIPNCDCQIYAGLYTIDCSGKGLTEIPNLKGSEVSLPNDLTIFLIAKYRN